MARNEQNTPFPRSLDQVIAQIDLAAEQGTDLHTLTVQLDNGRWRVDLDCTDEHLDGAKGVFWVDSSGNLL